MIINDKIHINSDEVEPYLSKLCEAFTYSNPELYEKKKLKLSTKGIADKLYHYQLDFIHGNRMVVLPRGALPKVKQFFKDNGAYYDIKIQNTPVFLHYDIVPIENTSSF